MESEFKALWQDVQSLAGTPPTQGVIRTQRAGGLLHKNILLRHGNGFHSEVICLRKRWDPCS